ncbi:carbohydrate ABC transporter permease [Occultella gossypii]|uniref:Carbohydrate ABC transporter permease n=1 Tax=Occultella gossypii TaxID=2800820 RepID=A0ABS7SCW1_9MICO|nr:carbohydrate ABC transporter permease [Occultella gossypii]MBZ2198097.1 carbohydrate ABC transporter permease [Occultella gossypii]
MSATIAPIRTRRRRRELTMRWGVGALLWLLAVAFVVPFVWMLSSSLKRNIDVFVVPMNWIPDPVQWLNYVEVWIGSGSLLRFFGNSLLVSGTSLVGDLLTASMAGYAFAMLRFRGRDRIFFIYLATAVVPSQLLLVPRFMFFQQLGLYNTLWALILPGLFTLYGTFLMRQFFVASPPELGEAARIDGANEWQVFWRIYLPLARPMLAALGIISFVGSWNDYETPLVMLSTENLYTIPLGLTTFIDGDGGLSAGLAMAASFSAVLPLIVIFLLFQRHFVAALAHTGIK